MSVSVYSSDTCSPVASFPVTAISTTGIILTGSSGSSVAIKSAASIPFATLASDVFSSVASFTKTIEYSVIVSCGTSISGTITVSMASTVSSGDFSSCRFSSSAVNSAELPSASWLFLSSDIGSATTMKSSSGIT